MRIKKVRIRNFRSIIDTDNVNLDEKITILLGKNEQGKTNFLKALESFGNDFKYNDDDLSYLVNHEDEQQIPIVTISFELDTDEEKALSLISEEFKGQKKVVITKYFDGHYEIEKPDLGKIQSKINKIKQSILTILKENEDKINGSCDVLNKIDKNKHVNWLKSLQRPDGGFWAGVGTNQSYITYTYYVVRTLMELDAINQINKEKLIQFIISCQHPNGGFGQLPNQQPQAQFTYHAIMLLKELKALNKIDKNKHVNWLKSLQRPDGGFWAGVGTNQSYITYTYYVVRTLMELDAINQINKEKLIQFIISCQHPNGGFGQLPNQQPQAQFTYHAIMLLKELKAYLIEEYEKDIKQLNKDLEPDEIIKLITRILSKEAHDEKIINALRKKLEDLKRIAKNNVETKIIDIMPKFVYFDSIDIIDDTISLQEYLGNKEKYKTFTKLFQLASLNVEKVKDTSNPHRRKLLFRNASALITGKINEFWTQENVKVNLDIDGDQVLVYIEDDIGAKADPPSRRSDGFRWFLSFYINFVAGTKGELENSILLLDNLAWVLHPSGQRDLLKTLEEIAKTNQIIFATHSPFLIDKNKLERIRIVERKEHEGTKVYEKFWDSIYDSLEVIRASIGANISDSLFGHKNNIVVEGFSDKIYLETMIKYLNRLDKKSFDVNKVMIIGAGGADKVPYLVSWFKAEKFNSLALLDADDEGEKVIREIKTRNIEINRSSDILVLNEISKEFKGKAMEIEDLFSNEFYCLAVNKAYKEIFENKLGKPEIKLEEVPTSGLRTKRYSKFFKENGLGSFDKIKVALEVKKILSRKISKDTENTLKETIDNFENLIIQIKKKFKSKEVEL